MALICQLEGSETQIVCGKDMRTKEQMAQGKSEAEVLRSIAHDIPMGRAGKPEEL
jgi:hypothetical protein